jgi:MFS family permease
MGNAKHVFFSFLFAIFALIFVFLGIISSTSAHHHWSWIYGFLALIYILCFILEIIKISELTRAIKQYTKEKEETSAAKKLLRQKQNEKERIEREMKEDKERRHKLEQEIEMLSEKIEND